MTFKKADIVLRGKENMLSSRNDGHEGEENRIKVSL